MYQTNILKFHSKWQRACQYFSSIFKIFNITVSPYPNPSHDLCLQSIRKSTDLSLLKVQYKIKLSSIFRLESKLEVVKAPAFKLFDVITDGFKEKMAVKLPYAICCV